MHRYNICVNTMMNQGTFRQTEDGGRKEGGRWGHCLWLTQGGSAFKSLHHLHWFPFLRSGGFKDLHSCDVKREKWGRKSKAGLEPVMGAFLLLARSSSSPTASSLPVSQARQRGWGGLCEARLGLVSSNPWPSAEQVRAGVFNVRSALLQTAQKLF